SIVGNGSIPAKGIWAPMINLFPIPKDTSPDYDSLAPKVERIEFLEPLKTLFKKDVFILVATNGVGSRLPQPDLTTFSASHTPSVPMQIGLSFVPSGVGAAIGSVIAGNLLDREYRHFVGDKFPQLQGKKRRVPFPPEFPLEKARLRLIFLYYAIYIAAMVAYGWCLQAKVPLAVPLFLQFLLAFASTSIYVPLNTLSIELYPRQAAGVAAATNLARCFLGAISFAVISSVISAIGYGNTFTVGGVVVVVFNIPLVVLRGARWRAQKLQ
ncbi:major facilitator superfamily domain-containing protein, partial [Blyttiomyces helicus]